MESKDPATRPARRVLYVVISPWFFLSHRLPLAKAARAAGMDVHVATPDGPEAAEIVRLGFPFHPLRMSRAGDTPLSAIRTFLGLVRLFRRLKPDLVHLVTTKPVVYGGIAARICRVPAVVHAVSGLGYVFMARGARMALLRAAVRRLYRFALGHPNARTIFQNPDDLAELTRLGACAAGQAVLIKGSGADLRAFAPAPEPPGAPVALLPARMLRDKGVVEFVDAARLLRQDGVEARFALAGRCDPGNPTALDEETIRGFERDGAVEWWGERGDMPGVLQAVHVVCLPSYREGLPKALIEAAASGRPIVTTDVPGCRETVRPGVSGLLVPPRDAPALADALRSLLTDAVLRRGMGAAGRELAEREFDIEHVVGETLALYRTLLGETSPAPAARRVRETSAAGV